MTNAALVSDGRRRIALLLEYDGALYAGSQLQTNALTVQAVLEAGDRDAPRAQTAAPPLRAARMPACTLAARWRRS